MFKVYKLSSSKSVRRYAAFSLETFYDVTKEGRVWFFQLGRYNLNWYPRAYVRKHRHA